MRVNEQISTSPVRVISDTGEQLGVISTSKAMEIATESDLDLVEVAPEASPPVCRIMDYGKYKYQQKKRQHKGHQHQTRTKEIRVRPKTSEHDIEVKVNRAKTFLGQNDKVLVTVLFKGRELAHEDEGRKVIMSVIAQLEEVAKVEQHPNRQGRKITAVLAPK